jgi:hypothetical protein
MHAVFSTGHGSLPVARLPGLREEILQFLLYDEVQPQMSSSIEEASLYPRLLYLLRLDTQALASMVPHIYQISTMEIWWVSCLRMLMME